MLTGAEMQLGRGETIADTARVLSRYVDAIMIRILDHADMLELARHATVPVINGLTKQSHPCQVMADIMTFEEHRGTDPRAQGRLERRLQQCAVLLDRRLGAFRFRDRRRLSARIAAAARAHRGRARGGRQADRSRGPRASRRRRQRRHLGLLGLDGRRGRGAPSQSACALSGQRQADEPRPPRMRSSCIACPPIAARK